MNVYKKEEAYSALKYHYFCYLFFYVEQMQEYVISVQVEVHAVIFNV